MNDDLQQLRTVLQALALPVSGQVRLAPDDCTRISVLIGAFNSACLPVCSDTDAPLAAAKRAALAQLEEHLARVCGEVTSPLCSELALRRSRAWRQVRLMARETLLQFQWPLEPPPMDAPGHNCLLLATVQ